MKRALYAFLVSCMLALTAIGFAACGGTQKKQVTLVDWEDKTIEVDLHSDVTVDNSAVCDTEGNAYAMVRSARITRADIPLYIRSPMSPFRLPPKRLRLKLRGRIRPHPILRRRG